MLSKKERTYYIPLFDYGYMEGSELFSSDLRKLYAPSFGHKPADLLGLLRAQQSCGQWQ